MGCADSRPGQAYPVYGQGQVYPDAGQVYKPPYGQPGYAQPGYAQQGYAPGYG